MNSGQIQTLACKNKKGMNDRQTFNVGFPVNRPMLDAIYLRYIGFFIEL